MKDKIQIVSWVLTRKCNLSCSYCAIMRDYKDKPKSYPNMRHYHSNEMSTEYVISLLKAIKVHNEHAFHLFYGGEPLLRKDLPDIINFCNENDIHYTIITNNSDAVQPLIEDLLLKTEYIKGLTSSIDPLILDQSPIDITDRYKKCVAGLARLQEHKGFIKDLVAEITVDNTNIDHLYNLVKMLTDMGINSDITTVDIAKSPYYDFSNVSDESLLVPKDPKVMAVFMKIINDDLDAHMAPQLLPEIFDILPAEMDCELEKGIHNMTIDADGSARLCLRVRGTATPVLRAINAFTWSGGLTDIYKECIQQDKKKHCRGCNWTCMLMSKMLWKNKGKVGDLIHADRREE